MAEDRDVRRRCVADTAIRIISRDGIRALTHRAVDREAGLPEGTTSYHARTRRALLELVVEVLAARAEADAERAGHDLDSVFAGRHDLARDEVAATFALLIEVLANRREDMRARYALMLELPAGDELRKKLTTDSAVHELSRSITRSSLTRCGLPASDDAVDEVIRLVEALVMHEIVIGDGADARPVLVAYLEGLPVTGSKQPAQ